MDRTFEESLKELEKLVKELENKEINLEDAINKYNEALVLSKACYEKLNAAKLVIKQINDAKEEDFNGES